MHRDLKVCAHACVRARECVLVLVCVWGGGRWALLCMCVPVCVHACIRARASPSHLQSVQHAGSSSVRAGRGLHTHMRLPAWGRPHEWLHVGGCMGVPACLPACMCLPACEWAAACGGMRVNGCAPWQAMPPCKHLTAPRPAHCHAPPRPGAYAAAAARQHPAGRWGARQVDRFRAGPAAHHGTARSCNAHRLAPGVLFPPVCCNCCSHRVTFKLRCRSSSYLMV